MIVLHEFRINADPGKCVLIIGFGEKPPIIFEAARRDNDDVRYFEALDLHGRSLRSGSRYYTNITSIQTARKNCLLDTQRALVRNPADQLQNLPILRIQRHFLRTHAPRLLQSALGVVSQDVVQLSESFWVAAVAREHSAVGWCCTSRDIWRDRDFGCRMSGRGWRRPIFEAASV